MINRVKTAEHRARNSFIILKRLTRMAHLFPGIALALVCSGCLALAVGAAGGAAGAVYVMGKLQDELNHSVSAVHKAALAAIKDLDLPVLQDKEDKLTANLESEFADGKHVWIDLDTVADSRTRITIRVGLTGDEVRSRRILDAIKQHLSQPASSAAMGRTKDSRFDYFLSPKDRLETSNEYRSWMAKYSCTRLDWPSGRSCSM